MAPTVVLRSRMQGNGHERDKLHFKDSDLYILDVYGKVGCAFIPCALSIVFCPEQGQLALHAVRFVEHVLPCRHAEEWLSLHTQLARPC